MGFCFSKNVQRTSEGSAPVFICSGVEGEDYNYEYENGNWEIQFLKTVDFVFSINPGQIDLFLVGGGGAGSNEAGGGGGYTKTVVLAPAIALNYKVTIGSGSSGTMSRGGESKAFGYYAKGGYDASGRDGGSGGSGGGAGGLGTDYNHTGSGHYNFHDYAGAGGSNGGNGGNGHYDCGCTDNLPKIVGYGGSGQGFTTRAFGESNGTVYSPGGGGGAKDNEGGSEGGGSGNGSVFGAGGSSGEKGSAGIVIIRNHRSTTSVNGLASETGTL